MSISLTGLDLAFLRDPKNRLPKQKRKPKRLDFSKKRSTIFGGAGYFLPDLDVAYNGGFESPIDGTFISSRSQLKEHNIRNDVIQAGDIRGERLKSDMKKHMKWDPAKRTQNGFSWVDPSHGGRSRSGNLTEI